MADPGPDVSRLDFAGKAVYKEHTQSCGGTHDLLFLRTTVLNPPWFLLCPKHLYECAMVSYNKLIRQMNV
jgi:hypothetical protein